MDINIISISKDLESKKIYYVKITDINVLTTMRQTIINDKCIHNNSLIYNTSINIKL